MSFDHALELLFTDRGRDFRDAGVKRQRKGVDHLQVSRTRVRVGLGQTGLKQSGFKSTT